MPLMRIIYFCLFTAISGSLAADCCPPVNMEIGVGYDYFRSLPEGNWEGNTGGQVSVNLGSDIPFLCGPEYGLQLGGSYGYYDWHGRDSAPSNRQHSAQKQAFVTAGISRLTPCDSGINFGVAYDWMWNENFGIFGIDTNIDQIRFQTGYLICRSNEFGLWGTFDLHRSHRSSQQIPVTYRALSQINAFWRHIFDNCAETTVWAGIPQKKSLMFSSGRAGRFIVGGSFKAPLTNQLGIEGHATYMEPHKGSFSNRQRNYAANICIELKWSFDKNAPYMPIGNNSNFLVDTNIN